MFEFGSIPVDVWLSLDKYIGKFSMEYKNNESPDID